MRFPLYLYSPSAQPPPFQHLQAVVHLLQLMDLHAHVVITQSPYVNLGFTLAFV